MPASEASVNGQYGTAVRRREDPPLIQGTGTYTDDVDAPGALHAHFVRSEVAHGRIAGHRHRGRGGGPRRRRRVHRRRPRPRALPAGADGARRHAAPDAGARRRALPGRGDRGRRGREPRGGGRRRRARRGRLRAARRSSSIPSARSTTTRRSCSPTRARTSPSQGGTADEGALEGADVVVRSRFVNQRLAAVPMEPSAAVAVPDPETGGVRIWAPLQAPHTARDVFAGALGLEKDAVRVTVPNVGGGFGARIAAYPEQAAVAAAALRLGKPVRYVESRWETMIAMQHGRAQVQDVELGARSDGTLVGIRVHVIADCGAYPGDAVIMPFLTGQMASGVYAHPARRLRLSLRGHQHDADRRLPRRRAPGGDRAGRARDGPARRRSSTWTRPSCAGATSSRPTTSRTRRSPAPPTTRASTRARWTRVLEAAGYDELRARAGAAPRARRRQAARDRPVHLRRAHRARRRGRHLHGRRGRHRHGQDRHLAAGPGPRDDVGAARVVDARRADGRRAHRALRHAQGPARHGDDGLAHAAGRRQRDDQRHPRGAGQGPRARGAPARGRRRRRPGRPRPGPRRRGHAVGDDLLGRAGQGGRRPGQAARGHGAGPRRDQRLRDARTRAIRSAPTSPSSRSTPRPAWPSSSATSRSTTRATSPTRCWPRARSTAASRRASRRRSTRRSPTTRTATASPAR